MVSGYLDEKTNSLLLVEEVGEWSRLGSVFGGEQSFKSEQAARAQQLLEDEWADILFVPILGLVIKPALYWRSHFTKTLRKNCSW